MALTLGACESNQGPIPPTRLPQTDLTGHWMLSAPTAPACGMELSGAPDQQQGTAIPEGGCPEHFYKSKRWTFAQETRTLTITDDENEPLAQLKLSGGQFIGQSTTGTPVTLAR